MLLFINVFNIVKKKKQIYLFIVHLSRNKYTFVKVCKIKVDVTLIVGNGSLISVLKAL